MPDPLTEYGLLYSGGGFLTRNPAPEIERIYPLEKWIAGEQRNGGHVFRRRIIVVEDWEEVPGTCQDCAAPPGHPHEDGCDVARCLVTGYQRLSCTRRHDHGRDVWTGEWPGVAECREFGWYNADGTEDLNRLGALRGEARWDQGAGRWVLR